MKTITRNSKFFKSIIHAIQEKKGYDICALDVKDIFGAVCDYFIIVTVANGPQLKAVMEEIDHYVYQSCGEMPYRMNGMEQGYWGIVDYVDIVVHVMLEDSRNFYQLEQLWHDAKTFNY